MFEKSKIVFCSVFIVLNIEMFFKNKKFSFTNLKTFIKKSGNQSNFMVQCYNIQ